MGNAVGCSGAGERLLTAARDGDVAEVRMLLQMSSCHARYTSFPGLNTPLHFAAARDHTEIVRLILENGANVNAKNYCGQTALLQACRYGHWEVVQTLMLFKADIMRTDYINGRTALHVAAAEGKVRCMRLLLAELIPSMPYEAAFPLKECEEATGGSVIPDPVSEQYDKSALMKFINKPAEGGLTALHMAALNGYFECVQLLLDFHADVSVVTSPHGAINLIGAGSTPLHYAACGGSLQCCQILLANGACRQSLNCNGWLPVDVAEVWGRHWLEPLLSPDSKLIIPSFPLSNHLSLPLLSVFNIAREYGLESSPPASDDSDLCAVCLERSCNVIAEGCGHELCVKCALDLCSVCTTTSDSTEQPGSIPCPLCRKGIISFLRKSRITRKDLNQETTSICNACLLDLHKTYPEAMSCRCQVYNKFITPESSELCPLSCSS